AGSVEELEVLDDYCRDIVARLGISQEETRPVETATAPRQLKVVIDAGNGMGGVTAVPVYRALGAELIEMYTEPDSNFPNHHADPTVTENLEDVIGAVGEHKADIGLAFDGDGDRIGVV